MRWLDEPLKYPDTDDVPFRTLAMPVEAPDRDRPPKRAERRSPIPGCADCANQDYDSPCEAHSQYDPLDSVR